MDIKANEYAKLWIMLFLEYMYWLGIDFFCSFYIKIEPYLATDSQCVVCSTDITV
jgi:hypothetical protein